MGLSKFSQTIEIKDEEFFLRLYLVNQEHSM